MKNLYKKISLHSCKHPKANSIYAVFYGEYQGGFITYIKEESTTATLAFFVVPDSHSVFISNEEFKEEFINNTLRFVETLPKDVYDVVAANFTYEKERKL